jgi:hypothetical protein
MKITDKTPPPLRPQPATWEYRSEILPHKPDLSRFTDEGWELVSVVGIPHDPGVAAFHFKRRK